jgi:hypothetical protein
MPLSANRTFNAFRYAMYFDGIDDRVEIPHSNSIIVKTKFTISAFFALGYFASGYNYIISKREFPPSAYHSPGYILIIDDKGRVGGAIADVYPYYTTSNIAYANGFLCNAIYVRNNSTQKLYINGVLRSTTNYTVGDVSNTRPLKIGCRDDNAAYFRGYISHIIIYSRDISDSEIAQLYRKPNSPPTDGIVLWLVAHPDNIKDIDNDGILEWIDLSGNNNHGKIYGATLTKVVKDALAVSPPKRIQSVVR